MITASADRGTMTTSWRHQKEALAFVEDKPGSMLAMEMGTGKSKVAIDLMDLHDYRRVLIICPLSVVSGVWPAEFEKHSPAPWTVLPLAHGSVEDKQAQAEAALLRSERVAAVINYESVWREPFASWAKKQPWELLVMDESHKLKSPSGKASWYCNRLSDKVPQRLALTGTPMPHRPVDIYAQYRALDKSIYGTSYARFKSRYVVMGGWNNKEIKGYQHEEEFREKFYSISYRVEAADVLDLPPLLTVTRMCELGPKARKLYRTLERDFVADMEEGRITAANALTRLLRLQQMTSGYAHTEDDLDVEVDTTKAELLADLLEDMGSEPVVVFARFKHDLLDDMGKEPVVVFARFKHDLEVVHRVARRLRRPSYEISGERKELSLWNENGGVLAVQIQSGGLGIDLTKARYAVYYSLGFSLGDYLQSRARLHRPGQTRPVEIIHLIAAQTVDEKVMAALAAREQIVESIMKRGLK